MTEKSDGDDPVPKLPRGRGLRFSGPELFRIALTVMTLIGVLLLARPCANAVSKFVTDMDDKGSAAKQMPRPGTVDTPAPGHYEQLRPGMSEAEIKAAMERSRARSAGSGSAQIGSGDSGNEQAGSGYTGSGQAGSGGGQTVPTGSAQTGSASASPSPSP